MKFGLYGLHRGGRAEAARIAGRARLAESAGFESLWVGDHIALPVEPWEDLTTHERLEALVALTYLAATTSRVRLGAGLIVLPQRQPVLLAKQLASIDVLSGGRLTVGVGVGYVEPELHALGVSPAERAARTEEYLDAMRALWDEPVPSFAGRFVSYEGVVQRPVPVQRPHPPIVVGGHSPAAYARAVRVGTGWYGWNLDPTETAASLDALRQAAERHDRPAGLGDLEITVTPRDPVDVALARRYADLGVHRLVLVPRTVHGTVLEELVTSAGETLIGQV